MLVTAIQTPAPEGGFTALNPETGSASQGETVDEAIANLREAVTIYLEEFPLKLRRARGDDLHRRRAGLTIRFIRNG